MYRPFPQAGARHIAPLTPLRSRVSTTGTGRRLSSRAAPNQATTQPRSTERGKRASPLSKGPATPSALSCASIRCTQLLCSWASPRTRPCGMFACWSPCCRPDANERIRTWALCISMLLTCSAPSAIGFAVFALFCALYEDAVCRGSRNHPRRDGATSP